MLYMNTIPLLSVRVASKEPVAQDIISIELVDPAGAQLPEFAPGAHIDVHLPGGLIRQYSLLNDSSQRASFQIGVLLEPESRGGSIILHRQVQAGDMLQISRPRNHFGLVPAAGHSLLFAGGIGITPILCMARRLRAQQAGFMLHYSVRTRARAAFLDDIEAFVQTGHALVHFDDQPETALDFASVLSGAGPETHIYICGPAGYIDKVSGHARDAGISPDRIHVEHFALAEADKPVIGDHDVAFQVKLASTGEVFDIPADETITSALDRQGVYIPVSCEEGICGTCLTGIVEGIPDHRDTYLTDDEHAANDQFMPCCSRSRTPMLVLDL